MTSQVTASTHDFAVSLGQVAVRVSAESGFDPGYMLKGQAEQAASERTAGGYYINAAQAGEAPGRWFGKGAEVLGFASGQEVEAAPFLTVYAQAHPVTGERLGRAPGGYAKTKDILARLLAGEPHATGERRLELEREAAQRTRRSPAYTDVTASHDKTISVVHAAIREHERRARLAGDEQARVLWAAREARWQEILQEGNRRGLAYLEQVAAWTRTGYHGRRVEGVEPGRWERALPVVTTWLQGTNRKGEPHDHVHNLWARMGITESDGKWRALDTMRIRGHLGAMAAVVAAYTEPALTAEFGVQWVRRADGMGNEIAGVTREWKDAFSTRTAQVDAKERRLALAWELRFGREPTVREMLFIRHTARDYSRTAKDDAQIDWDAEVAKWDQAVGGRLAEVADAALGRWQPGAVVPGPAVHEEVIRAVGVGPAGSGKTYTLGAAARAWEAGGGRVVGVTSSQAARNVLARAGIGDAWNSTRFLARMREPEQRLANRTLVIIDEGSTMSMAHLAEIVALAERDNAKVLLTGDHQQLAAVEAGGGMSMLARHLGYTQLAVPVRFTAEWEQQASLRLREGDKGALEAYDEYGRITGGTQDEVFEDARRAYVAARLAGEDVLLMAYTREDCRELSRIIRDDLVHLGLVDNGRSVPLAAGARASAGDLIVARENDHQLVTDPGHTLANGDRFVVDAVRSEGLVVRRVLEDEQLARRAVLYPAAKLTMTDPGYAVTGHTGQGGTVARGEAVFRGGEPREWAYVALTRGRERNTARVISQAWAADPGAGTQADPELARADLLRHERAGLPVGAEQQEPDAREPMAVLADCLDRAAGEESATDYQGTSMARADHLALLHARWADQVKTADRERYQRIVHEALPQEWRGLLSPQATWLYRTMQAAELAGLDPAEITQAAIRSRSLDGTRDVASVLDARLRAMVEPLVPLPLNSWSQRVPAIADPDRQEYARRLAQAMDERTDRIGEHAVQVQPQWALRALGPIPENPGERLDWQQRASAIGAYRELYGIDDERDPLGPEPAGSSPEQRAAWHAGFAALTRTDTVDVRALPEASLWHNA